MFGFNFISLIVVSILMNIAIGWNDVANDTIMVKLEQQHNLKGKIQAVQWISLGIAGLFVSIVGAWIASTFPEPINYKLAYAIWLLLPIGTLIYLKKGYHEEKVTEKKQLAQLRTNIKHFKNFKFLIGLLFIACLGFTPSFCTPLMIHMREHMHIDKMFLGYLGASGTVLGLIGYIIYYYKAHKYSMKHLLAFTIVFSTLANLCYLYIPTQWHILGYSIAFGAIDGICFLTIMAFMAKIIPGGAEGLMYAVITAVSNLSHHLSHITGGWIYDNFGYNMNVLLASGTTLLCLAFIPFLKLEDVDDKNTALGLS
jgi:predicted MFS family arabinose efflux permease